MKFERKKQIEEHCGMPHMPDREEQDELFPINTDMEYPIIRIRKTEEDETYEWIYNLSCGGDWAVSVDDDGELILKED
jgi:hypothetical protein